MIHCFEHLYLWDAKHLLREIHSILIPGGSLTLELPNLQYACEVIAGLRSPPSGHDRYSMWPIYGDPTRKDQSYGHRWGYTPKTLVEELSVAGFTLWEFERATSHGQPERDMRVVAWRE